VSVIIPTRDGLHLLQPCVDSVLANAHHYPGATQLLIVNNDSSDAQTLAYFDSLAADTRVRILPYAGKFNYSAINNMAAREASGEVLIFLNNDTQVLTPDWCSELVSHALRPEVGAVGARLLYEDHTLQHAGVVLGVEGLAGHEGLGESLLDGGYCGRSQVLHGASAVTAACLATRREVFLQLDGGFEEIRLQVAFNDVDFCLRVREAGLRVIYTPFATLHHFESKSRGRELTQEKQERHRKEALTLRQRWGDLRYADPFYNPHFERHALAFSRLCPPPSTHARVPSAPERFDGAQHRNESR
jgi:GT2 family glycosyltransferase